MYRAVFLGRESKGRKEMEKRSNTRVVVVRRRGVLVVVVVVGAAVVFVL